MGLYIGSIVSFQIPLVLVILIRAGLLDRNTVTDNRSFLWFAAAVFGAFVSPLTLSMFLIGGPMLVILEIALLLERSPNVESLMHQFHGFGHLLPSRLCGPLPHLPIASSQRQLGLASRSKVFLLYCQTSRSLVRIVRVR